MPPPPGVSLVLEVIDGLFAIARLPPESPAPAWAHDGSLTSITRTPDELSIVCRDGAVPGRVRVERGYRAMRVRGPLDLSMLGVLASIVVPLAEAGVALIALSTFDTDYLLVKAEALPAAAAALVAAKHDVRGAETSPSGSRAGERRRRPVPAARRGRAARSRS